MQLKCVWPACLRRCCCRVNVTLFSRVTLIRKLQSTSDLDHFHPRALPCSRLKSRDDPISGRRGDSGVLYCFIYTDVSELFNCDIVQRSKNYFTEQVILCGNKHSANSTRSNILCSDMTAYFVQSNNCSLTQSPPFSLAIGKSVWLKMYQFSSRIRHFRLVWNGKPNCGSRNYKFPSPVGRSRLHRTEPGRACFSVVVGEGEYYKTAGISTVNTADMKLSVTLRYLATGKVVVIVGFVVDPKLKYFLLLLSL